MNNIRPKEKEVAAQAVMEHLRQEGAKARVCIAAENRNIARIMAQELLDGHRAEFNGQRDAPVVELQHQQGGRVFAMSLDSPNRFQGPQWSYIWVALKPQTFTVLSSLENLLFGLRLGPPTNSIYTES